MNSFLKPSFFCLSGEPPFPFGTRQSSLFIFLSNFFDFLSFDSNHSSHHIRDTKKYWIFFIQNLKTFSFFFFFFLWCCWIFWLGERGKNGKLLWFHVCLIYFVLDLSFSNSKMLFLSFKQVDTLIPASFPIMVRRVPRSQRMARLHLSPTPTKVSTPLLLDNFLNFLLWPCCAFLLLFLGE